MLFYFSSSLSKDEFTSRILDSSTVPLKSSRLDAVTFSIDQLLQSIRELTTEPLHGKQPLRDFTEHAKLPMERIKVYSAFAKRVGSSFPLNVGGIHMFEPRLQSSSAL